MEKFAKLCGRSKGYISMLENGVNPKTGKPIVPSIETITQVSAAMQISVEEFLHMSGMAGYRGGFLAYYDGQAFVPITPVSVQKNQPVIVTILDEGSMSQADIARQAAKQLKGILSESGMSSEVFAANKQLEKERER